MVFTIAVLAVSLSLDSFGVGIAYGIRKINIPIISKLIICLFSIIYSGLAIITGRFMYTLLPQWVSRTAGVAILAGMGFYILLQSLMKAEKNTAVTEKVNMSEAGESLERASGRTIRVLKDPVEGDLDRSGSIDIRESLLLGLALSLDAIGAGIGSALAGLVSVSIPFAIGLCQLLFLYAGVLLGRKAAGYVWLNKKVVSLVPGLLLLILAILRIK